MRLNKRAIQGLGGVVRASARRGGRDLTTTLFVYFEIEGPSAGYRRIGSRTVVAREEEFEEKVISRPALL